MFLGWYDPDKKTPARYKLEDALERYARKFGRPAQTCITSPEDAAELDADKEAPTMPVRGVGFIPRYTFYVGSDEEAEEVVRPAAGNVPGAGERTSVRRKLPTVDSVHRGTTTVAKTRRSHGTMSTTAPESKPRAKRLVMDPVVTPVAKRASTGPRVNPEETGAKSNQKVKRGATRATPDQGVKPGKKPAKSDPGVITGTRRSKAEPGVKPLSKRTQTNPGTKPTKSLRD